MIKIKIINQKSISVFSYYIKIHNSNGLVYEGKIINGIYDLNNKSYDLYKLEVYSKCLYPYYKKIYFLPIDDIIIYFNDKRFLTFKLIDKNYNLPIKEGFINLCKKKNK